MVAVKVLVAGASGFVGRPLCPALAEAGHDIIAMTRHPGRLRRSRHARLRWRP